MMGQIELAPFIQVTLKAGFRRLPGINNRGSRPAGLMVDAARAMTRLTAHVEGVGATCPELGVGSRGEIARDILVALSATFRADELRAGNFGRGHDCASDGGAGDQDDGDDRADDRNESPAITAFRPACSCRVFHCKGPF